MIKYFNNITSVYMISNIFLQYVQFFIIANYDWIGKLTQISCDNDKQHRTHPN